MKELNQTELRMIHGGATAISGAMLTSMVKGIETIFEIGQSIGTAIRRVVSNTICPL